jgi:2,3,4,5-tetrahydropyridine-2,6-dicarboxylate N-succinyltransferase
MDSRIKLIEAAYENRSLLKDAATKQAVISIFEDLDAGRLRVVTQGEVQTYIKKALLLSFAVFEMVESSAGPFKYHDKIPIKELSHMPGVRAVPGSIVRRAAFVAPGAVLMPSFVNIGAYVGEGTMVDTWATVGSCAQIGARVHLSGGVGIGGVLEPPQASPVIIEDDAFIGSRAIVVEGVKIGQGAVLGANVVITASTKILDVSGSVVKEYQGQVPARSVVIPGSREKKFPGGSFQVPCALIIGQRKESTDQKTSLNEALRDFGVSV